MRTFNGTPEKRREAERKRRENWKKPEGFNDCPKCGSAFVGKSIRSEKIIYCEDCNFQIQGATFEQLQEIWNNLK